MLARYTFPLFMALACVAALFVRPVAIETSLYGLVGDATSLVPDAVHRHSANIVPIVVSSKDPNEAHVAADLLFSRIPTNYCDVVRYNIGGDGFLAAIDAYLVHKAGLVSSHDAELLSTPEGRARIARSALRKYYSSPVPPLFPPKEDPFCLLDDFVSSLPVAFSGWTLKNGVLQAERDGETFILLVLELKRSIAEDTEAVMEFGARLSAVVELESATHPDVFYRVSGAPMHTAATASRCKSEVGYLTWFSLLFIALLSFFAFRSVKWIPLLAASLLTAAGAGTFALLVVFRSIHIMTIVFGTTILGLVIDYSFHWLMHTSARRRETVRSLMVSFVTTEISLLPFVLSSISVLRQSFVFLGVGLAAAIAFVLCAYPRSEAVCEPAKDDSGLRNNRFSGAMTFAFLLVAVFGLPKVRIATDTSALYRPPAELAAAERQFAELGGVTGDNRGFLVTSGPEALEDLIELEDSVQIPDSIPRISRFMPPLSRRLANNALIEKLYAEHGDRQCELLGIDALSPISEPQAWKWGEMPSMIHYAFISDCALIVPSTPRPTGDLPTGVVFCRPRETLDEILSVWTREACSHLGFAFVLMFAVLAIFFRFGAFRKITPSLFAVAVVCGAIGLMGENVNLFHLLACFLLAGMGIDYAVFIHSGGHFAYKPAFCSLLTSMAGFGALAFVSFPVIRSFGIVLGIGLPAAFVCAFATSRHVKISDQPATEYGASPLGLEMLFLAYRLFGLRFLHFCASCVGLSVWLFSIAVRRASPSPRKIVAFTRSLADKLVVMANGGKLPKVELDGSQDSASFIADVAEGKGVFVLSSHCGTIEVLAALGECNSTFHAWMEFSRTSVFNAFYMRHARRGKVVIHPISDFGPETVFMAGDALDAGQCLVMAGDRGFGRVHSVSFLDGAVELPEGAFRFAHVLAHPVYFVACVAIAPCRYRAIVRKLPSGDVKAMSSAYVTSLERVVKEFPEQWFSWGRANEL